MQRVTSARSRPCAPLRSEVARAHGRSVRLVSRGLEEVPPRYLGVVKDMCIQMIRNAIAHGIEPPAQRLQHGKARRRHGADQVSPPRHASEYLLTVEDDGRGLSYEHIVDKALRLGLLQPAAGDDARSRGDVSPDLPAWLLHRR